MATYHNPFNYYSPQVSAPIFPQPNGNIYLISNSLEVANVPAGAGVTAALCTQENLLYLKTITNGTPTFLAYKLTPYNDSTPPAQAAKTGQNTNYEERIAVLETQMQNILSTINGGKTNDENTKTGWE